MYNLSNLLKWYSITLLLEQLYHCMSNLLM
nr:MAG TPA: hypothetical protein [Caudoviricetes sp.]